MDTYQADPISRLMEPILDEIDVLITLVLQHVLASIHLAIRRMCALFQRATRHMATRYLAGEVPCVVV